MNRGDGGLAKHVASCDQEIDWENSKIIGKEQKWTQRKYLEGVETLRLKSEGKHPLIFYNKMEEWQPILCSYFKM